MKLFHCDSLPVVALLMVYNYGYSVSAVVVPVTSANKVLSKVCGSVLIWLFETCVVKLFSLKILIEV